MDCQICFESFDSRNFVPKMLIGCGHSFCKICLERLINKKTFVNCPICREQTKLNNSRDSLPTNYSLVEILDKGRDMDKTKTLLERYKYFDHKSYNMISSKIMRYYEPKVLELKKIVNDDFIYLEEFENNQNVSIFNSFTRRNRRYNFNRNSLFRFFFNEHSFTIAPFRKASKCTHEYSCLESILRRLVLALCVGVISYFPLKKILKSEKNLYANSNDKVILGCQVGITCLLMLSKVASCIVSFYIDDLI